MSKPKTRPDGLIELDTADVDRWIGKPLGGARLNLSNKAITASSLTPETRR